MGISSPMADRMILELAVSVLLNPEDMGFYIGPYYIEADNMNSMNAHTFIVKLWFVMLQLNVFTPFKK